MVWLLQVKAAAQIVTVQRRPPVFEVSAPLAWAEAVLLVLVTALIVDAVVVVRIGLSHTQALASTPPANQTSCSRTALREIRSRGR